MTSSQKAYCYRVFDQLKAGDLKAFARAQDAGISRAQRTLIVDLLEDSRRAKRTPTETKPAPPAPTTDDDVIDDDEEPDAPDDLDIDDVLDDDEAEPDDDDDEKAIESWRYEIDE
jgi:hypothetical protein